MSKSKEPIGWAMYETIGFYPYNGVRMEEPMSIEEIEKKAVTQEEADGWCAVQRKRGHRVDAEPWSAATPAPKDRGDHFMFIKGTCYASCDMTPHPSERTVERCIVINERFKAIVDDYMEPQDRLSSELEEEGYFVVSSYGQMELRKFACRRLT
jgi:hypothetical protein